MKNLTLVCALLILSSVAWSQVKTGGGGPFNVDDDVVFKEMESRVQKLDEKVKTYTAILRKNEAQCTNGDKMIKDSDLMQVYLRLSLFKNSKYGHHECEEVNKFLSCLSNPASEKEFNSLLKTQELPFYLQQKYKINQEESSKIIKFFKSLGEKVSKDQ